MEELLRETERSLGGVERFAAQRMGGGREIQLEPRPQDFGGRARIFGELVAARIADGEKG